MTCGRTQEYLAETGITPTEEVNAKKNTLAAAQALALAKQADRLVVAKGQKVVRVDLKRDKPDDQQLLKLLLGPTGNLRAPTLRIGKTLVVGFNREMYDELLG